MEKIVKGKNVLEGAVLLCQGNAQHPHLDCFESKQGQNSTAIEREEPFFCQKLKGKTRPWSQVWHLLQTFTNFPKTLNVFQ